MLRTFRAGIVLLTGLTLACASLWTGALPGSGQKPKKSQSARKPGARPAAASAAPAALIAQGKQVYNANGCAVCHAIGGQGGKAGPDLTQTGADSKHTPRWMEEQVSNPKSHSPDSTMPGFAGKIAGKQLTAIGVYLASLKGSGGAATPAGGAASGRAVADPAAVAKIEKMGGSVRQIAQTDPHVEVNLHLQAATTTDAGLEALKNLKNVVHLDLGMTNVTDAGLVHLKGLTQLTELHLEGTKVTDKGLANLKDLKSLSYLNLYGTSVTDAGLESLRGLTGLQHLYVWQTRVTEAGANKLKQAIPKLEVVMGWDASSLAKEQPAAKKETPAKK